MRLAPNMSSKGSETALLAAKVGPALGLMATLANNLSPVVQGSGEKKTSNMGVEVYPLDGMELKTL